VAKKSRKGLIIGLSVGGGVLVLGIIAVVVGAALFVGKVKTHSGTVDDMVVPAGWEVYTARSGGYAYAYDPDWVDLATPDVEQQLLDSIGPQTTFTADFGGLWGVPDANGDNSAVFEVMGATYRANVVRVKAETANFVASSSAAAGMGDPVILRSESFTTPLGYSAWVTEYSGDLGGLTYFQGVIGIAEGDTLVFAYVFSIDDPDAWERDLEDLASSVVILGGI
jgi:hypothetical protein